MTQKFSKEELKGSLDLWLDQQKGEDGNVHPQDCVTYGIILNFINKLK